MIWQSLNFVHKSIIYAWKSCLTKLSKYLIVKALIIWIKHLTIKVSKLLFLSSKCWTIIAELWNILVKLAKLGNFIFVDSVDSSGCPCHSGRSHNVWYILIHERFSYRTVVPVCLFLIWDLIGLNVLFHCRGWLGNKQRWGNISVV